MRRLRTEKKTAPIPTRSQLLAARALLDCKQERLAHSARIGLATLRNRGAYAPDGNPDPAVPTTVVDTTGAGDCFCGALMAAMACAGTDPLDAAQAGAVAASFAAEGYGAEPKFAATPDAARDRGLGRPLIA